MPTATAKKTAAKKASPKNFKIETVSSITLPMLNDGEIYAGIILTDGKPSHHLILLPGDERKPWKDAVAWAKKQGGELPTRQEQALLYANAKEHFQREWYWSNETHADYPDDAWIQYFGYGDQGNDLKASAYRCRAVRRVAI